MIEHLSDDFPIRRDQATEYYVTEEWQVLSYESFLILSHSDTF